MRRISVAIVDDEPSVRVSLRRLCEALGLKVTIYASGQTFIDSLTEDASGPDCLLLDAHMPEMTGLEVQQQLANRGVPFPTLVYTADETPDVEERYVAAGIAGLLRKPIGGDELRAAIERALRGRR